MIKPILKYPGAKWNIAAWIISHFPAHQHYVEPYFGSGAVFFNKKPAKHEVINDLSGDVVNLFRVIREDGKRLAALIEMTPWAREEYELSYQPCDDPLERARRFVVRVEQAHANVIAARVGWRHTTQALNRVARPVSWFEVPDRIITTIERLRNAEIENKDAVAFIQSCVSPDALIYADPPYPHSTRNGKLYQVDSMTDADHIELLTCLDAHPGPVVLSGYHCPLYDDRLQAWHVREKQAQAEKGNTRTEVCGSIKYVLIAWALARCLISFQTRPTTRRALRGGQQCRPKKTQARGFSAVHTNSGAFVGRLHGACYDGSGERGSRLHSPTTTLGTPARILNDCGCLCVRRKRHSPNPRVSSISTYQD